MRVIRIVPVFVFALIVSLSLGAAAQETPAPLAGKWSGSVKADVGEMAIAATFKVEAGKVTGEITTGHGAFVIGSTERQKDGRWKLSFATPDGASGAITGLVKGDTFAGDWDFRPNAVGTFELTRVK